MSTPAQVASARPLSFRDIQFDIVDRDGHPWLRSPQIADALGYKQTNRVNDLYTRNASEFTASMTALVKLPDLHPQNADADQHRQNGGAAQTREVRTFSLRGAHLLGMLSRTKLAAEFRHWALDVLERETRSEQPALPLLHGTQRLLVVVEDGQHIAHISDMSQCSVVNAEELRIVRRNLYLMARQLRRLDGEESGEVLEKKLERLN